MQIFIILVTMFASFISLLGVIVVAKNFGFSPDAFQDPNIIFDLTTIVATFGVLLTPILIVLLSQKYLMKGTFEKIGLRGPFLKLFSYGCVAGLCLKVVALFAAYLLSSSVVIEFGHASVSVNSWLPYFLWFVLTLFLNSLNEELAYRSFPLQISSSKLLKAHGLIWIFALYFSAMHFLFEPADLLHFLYRLSFGLVAGFLFIEAKSLWLIVGLHTGWNFGALSIGDSDWRTGNLIKLSGIDDKTGLLMNVLVLALTYGLLSFFFKSKTAKVD